jgi:hypothetical protein
MRVLEISAKEADEIIAYDNAVDKGIKTEYDLTKQQEKETRKYRQADRRPTAYNFTKRERKPNATKGGLIQEFYKFLCENSEFSTKNVEILIFYLGLCKKKCVFRTKFKVFGP